MNPEVLARHTENRPNRPTEKDMGLFLGRKGRLEIIGMMRDATDTAAGVSESPEPVTESPPAAVEGEAAAPETPTTGDPPPVFEKAKRKRRSKPDTTVTPDPAAKDVTDTEPPRPFRRRG